MLKDLQARIDSWSPKQKLGDVFVQLVGPFSTHAGGLSLSPSLSPLAPKRSRSLERFGNTAGAWSMVDRDRDGYRVRF
jgi:hypothetical protein